MLIDQTANASLDLIWAALILFAWIAWIATLIMMYFVIWSRRDWKLEGRIAATVLVTFGALLPFLTVILYGIVDVATRRNLVSKTKRLWILAVIFLPVFGVFIYFIWALRRSNRPEAPGPPPMPPKTTSPTGTKTLTDDDLDFLQKLTDLHDQGVLTDEQYETQRQQRIAE